MKDDIKELEAVSGVQKPSHEHFLATVRLEHTQTTAQAAQEIAIERRQRIENPLWVAGLAEGVAGVGAMAWTAQSAGATPTAGAASEFLIALITTICVMAMTVGGTHKRLRYERERDEIAARLVAAVESEETVVSPRQSALIQEDGFGERIAAFQRALPSRIARIEESKAKRAEFEWADRPQIAIFSNTASVPELPSRLKTAALEIERLTRSKPTNDPEATFALEQTRTRYLPDTIEAYRNAARVNRDEAKSRLANQLVVLRDGVKSVLNGSLTDAEAVQIANGTFLQQRFPQQTQSGAANL